MASMEVTKKEMNKMDYEQLIKIIGDPLGAKELTGKNLNEELDEVIVFARRAYSKSLMESMVKRFTKIPSAENYTLLEKSMLRYQHDVMNLKIKRGEE